MRSAGIVAISSTDAAHVWTGGQYYLQHLVKCVASLPSEERVKLRDVWWISEPKTDPFAEVRSLLGPPLVVVPPNTWLGRLYRKIKRLFTRKRGARDLFEGDGVDIFFPTPPCGNSGTPYVCWISDFQHVRRPDVMADKLRDRWREDIAQFLPAAAGVVLSSLDARRDFASQFPEYLSRTHVVRFCSVPDDSWWSLDPIQVAAQYALPERFLIVCNQFTRHKNHLALVEAIALLVTRGRRDVHLVCTGSTFDYRGEDYVGQVRALVQEHGLEARISILGLVPRADQIALLRRAVAVVQPSLFEGWSTLVEDAKTLGKPIFVSDLPVHREQLGEDHPHFLDPDDPYEWAQAIDGAWGPMQPGPTPQQEKAGLAQMEIAKRTCGLAFVGALKAAATRIEAT
jgi:glycosyltransferase involved in cell wall biosynthesis